MFRSDDGTLSSFPLEGALPGRPVPTDGIVANRVEADSFDTLPFQTPSSLSGVQALLRQSPHLHPLPPHLFRPEIEAIYACGHYVSVQSFEAWSEMVRRAKAPPSDGAERERLLWLVGKMFCDYLAIQAQLSNSAYQGAIDGVNVDGVNVDGVNVDAVVAVPANSARFALRGFSLPHELGRALQADFGIPFWPHALRSLAAPELQMRGMEFDRRAQAVQGSIIVGEDADVRGRTLLLVDDVVCSGSTVREAARMLLEAGAAQVYAACLARVPLETGTVPLSVFTA